ERRGCRVARIRGLADRRSALPVRVAGRLLESPARTEHDEHRESTNTDRPPSPVHHPVLPPRNRMSVARLRSKELATTMPKGKAARTRCGRRHALVGRTGDRGSMRHRRVSHESAKTLRGTGTGLRTTACDKVAISVMSSARTG